MSPSSTTKKIRKWVLVAHIIAVAAITLPVSFNSCDKQEFEAIPVQVVPESALPATSAPPPVSEPTETPPDPDPTPAPTPEPAEPEPAPAPTPEPAEPEPAPEPTNSKNQLRTAEEIRQDARLDPVASTPRETEPAPNIDPAQLEKRIQKKLNRITTDVAVTRHNTNKSSANAADYYKHAIIFPILYRRWNQPTLRETGGRRPTTKVELRVRAEGRVTSARLVRPSGNTAMDSSVRQLLRGLNRLPPPSSHGVHDRQLTVIINFELEN